MSDVQGAFDATNAETATTPSGESIQQWIHDEQARLDAGLPISPRGIPPGYKVSNGRIVQTNWWDDWGKGATIGMGLGVAGGALFGAPVAGAASGAGSAGASLGAPQVGGLIPGATQGLEAFPAAAPGILGGAGATALEAFPGSTLPATGAGGYTMGSGIAPAAHSPGIFGSGAGAGANAAATTVAGKSALDRIISAARPATAATAAIGALTHGNGNSGAAGQVPPELQQFLDLQRQRLQGQNPLFQAVTQLAYDRMPTNATRGLPPDAIAQAMQAMTKGR